MLLVAILGAAFTFQTIFADIPKPRAGFSKDYMRMCLAANWLLFVLGVATTAWCPVLVGLAGKKQSLNPLTRVVPGNATVVFLLIDGAFLASTEAV